jgi:hypothetical protein
MYELNYEFGWADKEEVDEIPDEFIFDPLLNAEEEEEAFYKDATEREPVDDEDNNKDGDISGKDILPRGSHIKR